MYTGRTLTELAKELERQQKSKKDFMTPTNLVEMSVRQIKKAPQSVEQKVDALFKEPPVVAQQLQIRVADKFNGELTDNMHLQLGKWAGIPGRYYDRMVKEAPALLAANVNTWLHKEKDTQLVRTLDGKARAFLSRRYRALDNWDIAEATLPILINESKKLGSVKVMSSDVTENKLYIKAASERLTYEVKKGDAVQLGIVISNSETGHGSVRVEPFLYRLVCLNGAVIEDSAVKKYHIGRASAELEAAEQVFRDETRKQSDKAFMMQLGDIVRAAFNDENFSKLKGITIDASTRKIKAPIEEVAEEVAQRYNFGEKYKDSFLRNLIENGDLTQWGVANAVTQIANNAESYEAATSLERIGGELLMMDRKQWDDIAEAATAA